jgi:hypothetical protein
MGSHELRHASSNTEIAMTKTEYDDLAKLERRGMDDFMANETMRSALEQERQLRAAQEVSQRPLSLNAKRFGTR